MTDAAPESPKMDIVLPRLSGPELKWLVGWAKVKREDYPAFGRFLVQICMDELDRRTCNEEPAMIAIPNWNHKDLANALLASFILVRLPLSDSQAALADELHRHVVSNSVAYLEHFEPQVTA